MRDSPGVRTDPAPREQLVAEIRDRLARLGASPLQLLLILVLAGTAAFLASVAGFWLGVASMTIRYAIATVAGYVTFIALLRAWIAWQRGSWPDIDAGLDSLDIDLDVPRTGGTGDAFLRRRPARRWGRGIRPGRYSIGDVVRALTLER